MGNHGAAGGISERRRSSCSSLILITVLSSCYMRRASDKIKKTSN